MKVHAFNKTRSLNKNGTLNRKTILRLYAIFYVMLLPISLKKRPRDSLSIIYLLIYYFSLYFNTL